jgi:nitrite reductase/ring-hydroxylating ferredoxin subunit
LFSDPETGNDDLLVVGGEDHKTGQAESDAPFDRLERWTRTRFPEIQSIDYRWSGQIMEPVDGVAFIGRNPGQARNVYICSGDSGQGMTHGTIASILIPDLIAGRTNAWESLYDPSRVTLRATPEFARENLNAAAQYMDWFTTGEVKTLDDIRPGCGAVMRNGTRIIAAYRDHDGAVHQRSAVCPHLGGIVKWNDVEKTWDCPCHGSRFDRFGTEVLNGPANTGLAALSAPRGPTPVAP